MARFSKRLSLLFSIVIVLVLVSAINTLIAQDGACPVSITKIDGGANVTAGDTFAKGDTIKTESASFAYATLGDGAKLKVGPESILVVDVAYCPDPSTSALRLKLVSGTLWAQGHSSVPKFEISTAHFLATVGRSAIAVQAAYLDTSFTMNKESQKIETREWQDTVNVLSHTFPFKGDVSRLFALQGNVIMIPWGSRGSMLKQGQQTTNGYLDYHISNKPGPIIAEEQPFDSEGNYILGL